MPENLTDWLGFIVPEETTNYMRNPSFETGSTGWTPNNSNTDRNPIASHMGGYGMSVEATNASNWFITGTQHTTTAVGPWTLSCWMLAYQPVRLILQNTVSLATLAFVDHPGDGRWHRISCTALAVASGVQLRVYTTNLVASGWLPYYIDAFQLEPKSYMTSYCDGDQPECRWIGRAHGSASRRPESANSGGRMRSFRDLGVNVRMITGAGAPAMELTAEPYAILPGAEYQKTSAQARVMTLVCQALGTSRDNLHTLRQTVMSATIRTGRPSSKPIWLWYEHPNGTISQIGVYYEGGMEFGEVTRYTEPFSLRLIAYDPYWQSEHDLAVAINGQDLETGNGVMIRRNDESSDTPGDWGWGFLGYVAGDNVTQIRVIEVAPNGDIYIAGTFSQIGGVAANNIAYHDGTGWKAMGTGVAADSVRAILVAEDGYVYIGGSFTTIGGVAAARFARWDGTTYAAVQNFTSGTVMVLRQHPTNGRIYIGGSMVRGNFTGLDCYDPSTGAAGNIDWGTTSPITTFQVTTPNYGSTAYVSAMCFHNNELYFTGNWTNITWAVNGGARPASTTNSIAKFTPNGATVLTNAIVAIQTNLTMSSMVHEPYEMVSSADGKYVYMAGRLHITTGNISSSVLARWDGTTWTNIGAIALTGWSSVPPVSFAATDMAYDPDGGLWVCGRLTSIGPNSAILSDHLQLALGTAYQSNPPMQWTQTAMRFNGTDWMPVDVCPYYAPAGAAFDHLYIQAIAFTKSGEMLAGCNRASTGIMRGGTYTTISRPLSVDAPTPIRLIVNGPYAGLISRVTNWSSGDELYFRNPSLVQYRKMVVETEIGDAKVVLSESKNGASHLSGDSRLATFWLQPGENKISVYTPNYNTGAISGVGAPCSLSYRERLLSIDALPAEVA